MKSIAHYSLGFTLILFVGLSFTDAQVRERSPDYAKWSAMGCEALDRSPWMSTGAVGAKRYPITSYQDPGAGSYLDYSATISSAWPVQRAYFCRAKKHGVFSEVGLVGEKRYEELSTEGKAKVEQDFLRLAFSGTLVIHVSYSGTWGLLRSTREFWKTRTQEDLVKRIALVVDDSRTRPLHVDIEPDVNTQSRNYGHFKLAFPRQIGGRHILTPDAKETYLEIEGLNETVRLRFDVNRMLVRGELVY